MHFLFIRRNFSHRKFSHRVLSVIRQWVNNHWYDFEHNPVLLQDLCSFLEETDSHGKVINQYKKWCKSIKVTNFLFISHNPFHCELPLV